MTFTTPPEERSAWIMLLLALVGYPVYLGLLFAGAGDRPLAEIPFAWPMIWTTVGSIGASIVLHALARVYTDKESNRRDERDLRINRWSAHVGLGFVVAGALAGLGLAMLGAAQFWIANAIFLGFFLSSALGAIVKIVAYRRGLREW